MNAGRLIFCLGVSRDPELKNKKIYKYILPRDKVIDEIKRMMKDNKWLISKL
jgi:hypothetical protein